MERESLRLLLSLTPWIQTDLLPNVVGRVGWSSFTVWRCGRHWLEFLQSCPSPRRHLVSDLKTSTSRFRAFNLGPRGT